MPVVSFHLACRACLWRTVAGREDAIARLRLLGQLRREPHPADELLAELFLDAARRMTCPVCKEKRLVATPADLADDDGDWQSALLCEVCREPIPPERVEALPGVKRCVTCQGKTEAGVAVEEPDYCPRCGARMEIRVTRTAGITRYRQFCTGHPPCRL